MEILNFVILIALQFNFYYIRRKCILGYLIIFLTEFKMIEWNMQSSVVVLIENYASIFFHAIEHSCSFSDTYATMFNTY